MNACLLGFYILATSKVISGVYNEYLVGTDGHSTLKSKMYATVTPHSTLKSKMYATVTSQSHQASSDYVRPTNRIVARKL